MEAAGEGWGLAADAPAPEEREYACSAGILEPTHVVY